MVPTRLSDIKWVDCEDPKSKWLMNEGLIPGAWLYKHKDGVQDGSYGPFSIIWDWRQLHEDRPALDAVEFMCLVIHYLTQGGNTEQPTPCTVGQLQPDDGKSGDHHPHPDRADQDVDGSDDGDAAHA